MSDPQHGYFKKYNFNIKWYLPLKKTLFLQGVLSFIIMHLS